LPNESKFGSKHPWKDSIKIVHLVAIRKQTWPPQAIHVSDWLISKKSSLLKPRGQMNQNVVGTILGRSSINIANLCPDLLTNMADTGNSVFSLADI
jgi:hypothetical protein